MMAEKTCLLVRNYPLQDLKKEQLARLEQMLDNLQETAVLIFFFWASHSISLLQQK